MPQQGNRPTLADVSCTPLRFLPGDKLLVRLRIPISPEQALNLKKTVEKWAGVEALLLTPGICDLHKLPARYGTNRGGEPGPILSPPEIDSRIQVDLARELAHKPIANWDSDDKTLAQMLLQQVLPVGGAPQ